MRILPNTTNCYFMLSSENLFLMKTTHMIILIYLFSSLVCWTIYCNCKRKSVRFQDWEFEEFPAHAIWQTFAVSSRHLNIFKVKIGCKLNVNKGFSVIVQCETLLKKSHISKKIYRRQMALSHPRFNEIRQDYKRFSTGRWCIMYTYINVCMYVRKHVCLSACLFVGRSFIPKKLDLGAFGCG